MSDSFHQPVQLRIGFSGPTRALALELTLAGLSVLAGSSDSSDDEVWQYLTSVGISAIVAEGRGVSFPVRELPALSNLPSQVHITADADLAALLALARNRSAGGIPATLSVDPSAAMRLGWFDGTYNWDEEVPSSASAALLSSDLPFVATAEAWEQLKASCTLPVLAGRARLNLDGFVEIATSKPQLVESSPLPGLFRLDDTHFGIGLPFAAAIDLEGGFVWEGRKPALERAPQSGPNLPISLSAHATADLSELTNSLAAYRAQAVIWDSGLGRRVFALAAIAALDAWPLLIVCPPSAMWIWQRHLDLIGRSHSLTHDGADAHLLTYRDITYRRNLPSPAAIIFDSPTCPEASTPETVSALHRLDGVLDAYRVLIDSTWPDDLTDAVGLMALLRPGEFRADMPVAQRYPTNPDRRAREHVGAYLSVRRHVDDGTDLDTGFRRSAVRVVAPTDAQTREISELARRLAGVSPQQVLAELLEIISAGPAHAVAPKVASAAQMARAAATAGRRVAVATRYRRTATLIRQMLRPLRVEVLDSSETPSEDVQVSVIRFDRELPNLRAFDEVIVVDYPWSAATLERSVGAASDDHGPAQVTVIHAAGTVDDRLAMLAARRSELAAVADADGPPTLEEIAYLLSPRSATPTA